MFRRLRRAAPPPAAPLSGPADDPPGDDAERIEQKRRARFFKQAADLTPYVAAQVDDMVFLVETWDRMGATLFRHRTRGEMDQLRLAIEWLERLGLGGRLRDSTFVDVGANIGTTTVTAVMRHGFARAVAVEPEPRNLRTLRATLAVNGLEERVRTLGFALGNREGEATLTLSRSSSGEHRVLAGGGAESTLAVRQRTLDGLVAAGELDPAAVGLLWMDTQGSEGHVLAGGTSLVERGVPFVAELAPRFLAEAGGLALLREALARGYTHLVDLRAQPSGAEPALRPASELERLAAEVAGRANGYTDILVLRREP